MKAVRIHNFGGPDVLHYEVNVPLPTLGESQVMIRAAAAGVNPVDVMTVSGKFLVKPKLPWIPGTDAAGVVEAVGSQVTKFKVGDRVFCAGAKSGAYAEMVVAEEFQTGFLRPEMPFSHGAAIGVPYCTAYRAVLQKAKAKAGEIVLIPHVASSTVGLAAMQICKSLGLRILVTAGTEAGLALAKSHGADVAVNHREKGYEDIIMDETDGAGPDIVLEMAGHSNLQRDLQLLAVGGRIMIIGGGGETKVCPTTFLVKEATVKGVTLSHATDDEWTEITAGLEAGIQYRWVSPVVAKVFPLDRADAAHVDIIANPSGGLGTTVLAIQDDVV